MTLCDSSVETETQCRRRTRGAAIQRKFILAVVALVICLAVVEEVCHRTPHTRWQVVQDFEVIDGIPVYGMPAGQGEGVRNDACLTEDGADVLLLGDSILHGVLLDDRETLGPRLSQALKHAQALIKLTPEDPIGFIRACQDLIALDQAQAAKSIINAGLTRHQTTKTSSALPCKLQRRQAI